MTSNKTLKQLGNGILGLSAGLTIHSWYLSMKDNELKKLIKTYQERDAELATKLLNMQEDKILSEQTKNEFIRAANQEIDRLTLIKEAMDANNNKSLIDLILNRKVTQSVQTPQQSTSQTIIDAVNNNNVNWNSNKTQSISELKRLLDEYGKSGSNSNSNLKDSTNFFDKVHNFIESYMEWLDHLNMYQKGVVANILVLILILSCLISLIAIYYSDLLIKYFNLETNFPRLAKYINLRRKFQQYYFFFNSIIIIISLITLIIMNIFAFSVYAE